MRFPENGNATYIKTGNREPEIGEKATAKFKACQKTKKPRQAAA
jgi:hypothetical protein